MKINFTIEESKTSLFKNNFKIAAKRLRKSENSSSKTVEE